MFNFHGIEKANEMRREELLKEAAQDRLAREFEGNSPGMDVRLKSFLGKINSSLRGKNSISTSSAKTMARLNRTVGRS